jgi:hypothetical protein
MKEITISKIEEIEVDYSSYDNVKIVNKSEVYVCIERFLKFQFSEFVEQPTWDWRWSDGTSMFGYYNRINCYRNRLTIQRKIKPFPTPFLTPDNCYNFPVKELKKILKHRKDRKQKDVLNNNANAFSFDIFCSIILEELRTVGFENVERIKSEYYNKIEVWNKTKEKLVFRIFEVKLKSVIRKQQEFDETFPLSIELYGKSGAASYLTTWGIVKKLLPGLLEIKN